MRRTFGTLLAFVISASLLAANGFSAEPDRAPALPLWGTVTKASAESITIASESAARQKPDEQTFALLKDQTQIAFAEVAMRGRMADGSTVRTINDPEPA